MKGVSPLIAVVLTIAFTVGVAALISGWLTVFSKSSTGIVESQSTTKINCNYGGIRIVDDSMKCGFTGSSDRLNFTIENTGTINLYNFTGEIYLNGIIYSYDTYNAMTNAPLSSGSPIKPNERKTLVVNITDNLASANPDWVRIVTTLCPTVSDKSTNVTCS